MTLDVCINEFRNLMPSLLVCP